MTESSSCALDTLRESQLKTYLSSQSLNRARRYFQQGRVRQPRRRGDTLLAQVRGSRTYDVEISCSEGRLWGQCSCLYDWGGYCKHIGAVLLAWIYQPVTFVIESAAPEAGPALLPVIPWPPPQTPSAPPAWLTDSRVMRQSQHRQLVEAALTNLKVYELRDLAQKRGWPLTGNRKADIVAQIVPLLLDPVELARTLAALPADQRAVLQAVAMLDDGGGAGPTDVKLLLAAGEPKITADKIASLMATLAQQALLLPGAMLSRYEEYGYRAEISYRLLPAIGSQIPPLRDGTESPPEHVQARPAREMLRTVQQIWGYVQGQPVLLRPPRPRLALERDNPTLQGWDYDVDEVNTWVRRPGWQRDPALALTVPPAAPLLSDAALQVLAPFADGLPAQAEFIYHLLRALDLVLPGQPVTVYPEAMIDFLKQPEPERVALLARAAARLTTWNELDDWRRRTGSPTVRRLVAWPQFRSEHLSADLARARRLVWRFLAALPDGQWASWPALLDRLRAVWRAFTAVPPPAQYRNDVSGYYPTFWNRAWHLTSGSSSRALDTTKPDEWDLAQGRFIQAVVTGPLYWLGLVELGFHNGRLTAVRPVGLADVVWDRPLVLHDQAGPTAEAPAAAVVIDEAALTVTVEPSSLPGQAHGLLDAIARLTEASPERFVYRLEVKAAHQAFESGRSLDNLLADWSALMPEPLPDAFRQRLEAWWAGYGRVRLYDNLSIIELADDYILQELKASTSLGQHLILEISPRLVVIPRAAIEPLMAEMIRKGYTPKQTQDRQ
ncbi:MAG: helicase-associated domain-containing protein [Chloroflexi bacterium]|nr:helicase-associated domain-containing protein [Chloroflexota bacterium]MBU1751456.1 helicase-associated domain-containing protein [Chloroflexota bacterium]